MNTSGPGNLEKGLAALSEWPGDAPRVWEKALDAERAGTGAKWTRVPGRKLLTRRVATWAGVAALVLVVGFAGLLAVPSLGGGSSRFSARKLAAAGQESATIPQNSLPPAARSEDLRTIPVRASLGQPGDAAHAQAPGLPADFTAATAERLSLAQRPPPAERFGTPAVPAAAAAPSAIADAFLPRQVARRASIALEVANVRDAADRVAALIHEDRGEFIEDSTVNGAGRDTTANFALRVVSTRFGDVLAAIRQIGGVASETAAGEDVTDQIVDLEARIGNERKIEQELQALVETRRGAPLRDLLEVRDQLSRVRVNIERMQASRDRTARRVGLATIVVSIRTTSEEPEKGFSQELGVAWTRGTLRLGASAAEAVEWMLASLMWLLAVLVLLPIAVGVARRLLRFSTMEPAPRL